MLNNSLFQSVADLLPHTGEMLLLDTVEDWGEDFLTTSVHHHRDHWFTDANGNSPAWIGIEYMAQSIGALAGIKSLLKKQPIRIGLLLGTRKYVAHQAFFEKNIPVIIKVKQLYLDENNLALFDCKIRTDKTIAQAQIKAILPENINDLLKTRPTK